MLLTVARYSLREAIQNRLALVALILLLVSFLLVEFVGALAITEHRAIQATLFAALLRVMSVVLIVLFVISTLLREQQERSFETLLALSHPRAHYVLGKTIAYAAIAVVLALACGLALLGYADPTAVAIWTVSLACELVLVAGLGLLLAFTFRQTVAAVAVFGVIYAFARVMGALLLMLQQPTFGAGGWGQAFIEWFLGGLAWILPSLYRFTDAGWLTGDAAGANELLIVVGQTAVYVPLLLAAAMVDLYRREF